MSLLELPTELLLDISDLLSTRNLSVLSNSCQHLHHLLLPSLHKRISTEHLANTILRFGIHHNYLPTVHLALAHSAEWHRRAAETGTRECSAISLAASLGHTSIVDALIKHYGSHIVTEEDWMCHDLPLYHALSNNHVGCAGLLLAHGADPAYSGGKEDMVLGGRPEPLVLVARHAGVEMARVLLSYGAKVTHWPLEEDVFWIAAERGKWELYRFLVRNANESEWEGMTGGREVDVFVEESRREFERRSGIVPMACRG